MNRTDIRARYWTRIADTIIVGGCLHPDCLHVATLADFGVLVRNFWEILRALHVANCQRSVDAYLGDIEKARAGLQRSLDALAAAEANQKIHDHAERSSDAPPQYLLKDRKQ